jgi:hypothetical protein
MDVSQNHNREINQKGHEFNALSGRKRATLHISCNP